MKLSRFGVLLLATIFRGAFCAAATNACNNDMSIPDTVKNHAANPGNDAGG